jgi:hypothetical protein
MVSNSTSRRQGRFEQEPLMWDVGTSQWAPGAGTEFTPLEPVDYMQVHVAPGTIMGRVNRINEDGTAEVRLGEFDQDNPGAEREAEPLFTEDLDQVEWRQPGNRHLIGGAVALCRLVPGIHWEISLDGDTCILVEEATGQRVMFDVATEWPYIADFIIRYRDYLEQTTPGDLY